MGQAARRGATGWLGGRGGSRGGGGETKTGSEKEDMAQEVNTLCCKLWQPAAPSTSSSLLPEFFFCFFLKWVKGFFSNQQQLPDSEDCVDISDTHKPICVR